jgi:hypothetical protein
VSPIDTEVVGGLNHTTAGVFNLGSYDPKGIEMSYCSENTDSELDSSIIQITINESKTNFITFCSFSLYKLDNEYFQCTE